MLAVIEPAIVLRPHLFGSHMRSRWRYAYGYLPLLVVSLAREPPRRGLAAIAIGLATGGILLAISARIRLALDGGDIRRTSWWGRNATCPVAAVAEVVDLTADIIWIAPSERWLLFRDADGRTLMRALVSSYRPEEVDGFLNALDRPVARIPGILKVREVRRQFPGSFHWPWAHYWLTFFLVLLGAFCVAILVVGIVDAIR